LFAKATGFLFLIKTKKMKIYSIKKTFNADLITPVGIYLQIRDKYRNALLLENSDYHIRKNARSFICCEPLITLTVEKDKCTINTGNEREYLSAEISFNETIKNFMQRINVDDQQALFGYTSYEVNKLNKSIQQRKEDIESTIPLAVYSLYKHIICIDHFRNEAEITCLSNNENELPILLKKLEETIKINTVNSYLFRVIEEEKSDCTDAYFKSIITKAKEHCRRGDTFQMVLSRRFERKFEGDEFTLYRALRKVNPSPYLFFFDYDNFKLFGSSPEAQLIVQNGKAEIQPIAGTYKRGENDLEDFKQIKQLLNDQKEVAEHIMLVDLARNDLSIGCANTKIEVLKEPQLYSHVIHLVSKVSGTLKNNINAYQLLTNVSPAGTLSGAPKHRAMELIDELEKTSRSFYGGAIGIIGFNNSLNHAIMIRTFMSKNNTLYYRAGAGVVEVSNEQSELNEVNNKIGALRLAIEKANNQTI